MKTCSFFKVFAASVIVIGFLAQFASAAEVGVRIRFGLTDKQPTDWDAAVSVSPGKVAAISGWRFEQTDHANGTEGWSAATRAINPALRTNAQKAKAQQAKTGDQANQGAKGKGKKGGGAAAKAKAKANADGVPLADNG